MGVARGPAHAVGDQGARILAGSRRLTRLGSEVVEKVRGVLGEPGTPVVVALSGGADSAVLTWAILQDDRAVRAVHVHHGWIASDRMESAATAVADRLGVELQKVRISTSGPGSPEEAARRARYGALQQMIRPGEVIATGHTLTDQAETVLGNLIWGSGLDGLRGVRRSRNSLIRPLLDVTRSETRELARLLGLPFVDDPANQDEAYRRVRIRRTLVEWERSLSSGISFRLADLAGLAEGDLAFLDAMASEVNIEQAEGTVRIPTGFLRTLPLPLAARVVRRALRAVVDGYPGSRRDVEAVLDVARGGSPAVVTGGHPVRRAGAHVRIGAGKQEQPGPLRWDLGETLRWGGWTWEARECPGRPEACPFSPWRQVFDIGALSGRKVLIRGVSAGDRIAMREGHKHVSDAMSEAHIPSDERDGWPVMEVDGRIAWIPGVRRAYAGWVNDDTMGHVVASVAREETWKPVGY